MYRVFSRNADKRLWGCVVQYGTSKAQKPRLTTKSGKTRHLLFRKHAQGKI